ncbi:MAG TPA: MerR family transcriptional regulator [Acholeplasmataceae bacterium]|jgi:DNA-binding transcriptional MerR regulator|nr:MerR family transcriptional regulator [Acholeplasmataceae bacterium]
MEYTIKKFAELANISTRTLRYYDEIGLLKPAKISESGYRIYGEKEVDLLQQILFYKELGLNLNDIKKIIYAPDFNIIDALNSHLLKLKEKQKQILSLINTLEKTINEKKGGPKMKDYEKFEGFKKEKLEENEKLYGKEIREKYGEKQVEKSNEMFMNMTKEEYEKVQEIEQKLYDTLKEAFALKDHTSPLAQKAAELHKKWLSFYWPKYHKEAHANLVRMYVEDERFTAYYDKLAPGMTIFLRDAVLHYLNNN